MKLWDGFLPIVVFVYPFNFICMMQIPPFPTYSYSSGGNIFFVYLLVLDTDISRSAFKAQL